MSTKNKPAETGSLLRVPKPKAKLGLKVPQIAMPHDGLIFAEGAEKKPKLEIVPNTETAASESETAPDTPAISPTLPSQTRQTTQARQTSMSSQTRQTSQSKEIAPSKNYHKVSNSITRQAIPGGLFQGKSKQLYDVLYALTRGAITPKREIRISKSKLMKQSGIGSRITFDACVERLEAVGLLEITVYAGEHEGNSFKIYLPEELSSLPSQSSQSSNTSQTSQSTHTSPTQKLVRLEGLETSQTSQSTNELNTTSYENPKTFFKTDDKTGDDEFALAGLTEVFEQVSRKYTGKNLSLNDREKWRELAELLCTELDIAAARTSSISNVPAFLTAHLRRRLLNQKLSRTGKPASGALQVGKSQASDPAAGGEPVKLTEEGRRTTIELMRAQLDSNQDYYVTWTDFLENEKFYTPEDWEWMLGLLAPEFSGK